MKYTWLFLLLLSFSSCSIHEKEPLQKTTAELLVNKKWQLIAVTGIASAVTITDGYSGLPDWDKDNYYVFNSNNTFFESANLIKEPNETRDILIEGPWALTQSDKVLTLGDGSIDPVDQVFTFNILTITEQNLVLRQPDLTRPGDERTYTFVAIP